MITLFPQKEKFVWCKQIRNSLSRVPFQNKNFGNGNFSTLNFSKFQIFHFSNQPNIQWCPWVHITSFFVSPRFRFIGWVVGFPQLIWEYPKNLPPSPSHFWGGVACGCCIRRWWKEVPDLFRYQFWQWFLQPISFTPNFEITPLCDKKNI